MRLFGYMWAIYYQHQSDGCARPSAKCNCTRARGSALVTSTASVILRKYKLKYAWSCCWMILYVMQADGGAVCTRVNHTWNEWAQSGQNSLIAWVDLHQVFFFNWTFLRSWRQFEHLFWQESVWCRCWVYVSVISSLTPGRVWRISISTIKCRIKHAKIYKWKKWKDSFLLTSFHFHFSHTVPIIGIAHSFSANMLSSVYQSYDIVCLICKYCPLALLLC